MCVKTASRVSRAAATTRHSSQRTTRSQSRQMSEKAYDVSGKSSSTKGVRSSTRSVPMDEGKVLPVLPIMDENISNSGGAEADSNPEVQQSFRTPGRSQSRPMSEKAADVSGKSSSTKAVRSGTSSVPMDECKVLLPIMDENVSNSGGAEPDSKPEVQQSFRTPGRSRRAHSVASPGGITFASVRKTPKNLRNSLLLRRMSPEEGFVMYFCFAVHCVSE